MSVWHIAAFPALQHFGSYWGTDIAGFWRELTQSRLTHSSHRLLQYSRGAK
jgi:hypothetical protein